MPNPTVRNKATTGELVQAGDPANNAVRVNVVAGAGSGGTAATDDAAFTPGGSSYTPAGGTYRSVLDPVDDGDGGAFAMTQTRAIFANIRDDAGDSAMDGANNALRVNIVAGAGSGGTAATDDSAFTPGGTSVTPMGAYYDDTAPDNVDEGDIGAPRMSADRILYGQFPDRVATGTLNALDAAVAVTVVGAQGCGIFITTANLSATVIPEISYDGGTTWIGTNFVNPTTGIYAASEIFTGGSSTRSREVLVGGGVTHARLRVSLFTSGSATATLNATTASSGWSLTPNLFGTADNLSNTNVAPVGSFNFVYDGAAWDRQRGDSVDGTLVNLGTNNDVRITDGSLIATVRDTGTSDSLNVAIVDASGNQITSFGGGTEYTEDVATPTDPVGGATLLRRRDTPAGEATTAGDWVAANATNFGAQFVQVVSSSGSFIDSFGGSGGTAQADRSAFTDGTTNMTPIGGVLNDTPTDPTEDQAAAVRITAKRAMHVNLRNAAGAEVTPASSMTDDGAFSPGSSQVVPIGAFADDTATDSVDEGDVGIPRMSLDRVLYGEIPNLTASATLNALDAAVTVALNGKTAVAWTETGTLSGQLTPEVSFDGGTNWIDTYFLNTINLNLFDVAIASGAGKGVILIPGNATHARLRVSTFTSGSSTGTLTAGSALNPLLAVQVAGETALGNGWKVHGGVAHDADASVVAPAPLLIGGYSSAAAPTSVSADLEAVRAWYLRNGAAATVITAAGALIGGDATNGLDVDVTRVTGNITVVGAAAHASPASGNPVYVAGRASTALPTDVGTDGDAAALWTNRNGAQVVAVSPHIGLNSDPYNLIHEAAQYTTTQTSTVLIAGGASEKIVVTRVQIQTGGTTAGTLQLYFGTAAFSRGTSRAIFDGEFAPSATLKPGVVMEGPFISGTNGDDLLVTTSAAINPLTINVWYYLVV